MATSTRYVVDPRRTGRESNATRVGEVKYLWQSVFDPNLTRSERQEHLDSIYRCAHELVRAFSGQAPGEELRTLLGIYDDSSATLWRNNRSAHREKVETRLRNGAKELQGDPIVIPVMRSGMFFGALATAMLVREGLNPDMALVGFPRNKAMHGNAPENKIFIWDADLRFLKSNTNRTVLIADDTISTDVTMQSIAEFLSGLGFTRIFKTFAFTCDTSLSGKEGALLRYAPPSAAVLRGAAAQK